MSDYCLGWYQEDYDDFVKETEKLIDTVKECQCAPDNIDTLIVLDILLILAERQNVIAIEMAQG